MAGGRCYEFGPFSLDTEGRLLFRKGKAIPLAPKIADTLVLLVENAGKVVEKEALLKQVWQDAFVEEGSLTRTISVLRKALGGGHQGQEYIATVSKRGYRFATPVTRVDMKSVAAKEQRVVLAVLPFENLSGEKHDYFSEGLTEEMITQLARLNPERMGVIARTSAMQYKSTTKTIQQIGLGRKAIRT
jgi:DNA-binding winged helix-turn-helix (wHTH) protein